MSNINVKEAAEFLNDAELSHKDVFRLTLEHPELTIEEAYDIQHEIVALKIRNGSKLVGLKMGLTSAAKMKQMNVNEPLYGHLFDYMLVNDRDRLSMEELIHPKAEPEIAFIMGKDLAGPEIDENDVLEAIESVLPVMEIIDSRYENFNFTLKDTIADNCSSSRVIVGSKFTKPQGLEMDLLGVTISINNEVKALGTGAAVLGHPLKPVVILAKMLAKRGLKIKAGSLILTGGVTQAFPFKAGDIVSTKIEDLGEVSFKAVE